VTASHAQVWNGIREAHIRYDQADRKTIEKHMNLTDFDNRVVKAVSLLRAFPVKSVTVLGELAAEYVRNPNFKPDDLQKFASDCIDRGVDVPRAILEDVRYAADPWNVGTPFEVGEPGPKLREGE
jgi:hypothetical protein